MAELHDLPRGISMRSMAPTWILKGLWLKNVAHSLVSDVAHGDSIGITIVMVYGQCMGMVTVDLHDPMV